MSYSIVPIVEGHGDVKSAASLIRRVLSEQLNEYGIQVAGPKRLRRNRIDQDLPRMLQYAAQEPNCVAIIIVVDADECCVQELAENISRITRERNLRLPVSTVCPKSEYETWFIASIDNIRGQAIGKREARISQDAICPTNIEDISDAKKWISDQMPKNMSYKPTQDQEPLTRMIDFKMASERSRSFRRLCHAVEEVVTGIRTKGTRVTPLALRHKRHHAAASPLEV